MQKKLFIIIDSYGTIIAAAPTKFKAERKAKELTRESEGKLFSVSAATIAGFHIHGRRYWDKVNGNTYESTCLYIYFTDGKTACFTSPLAYGSDHQETARELLMNAGFWSPTRHENGSWPALWRATREANIGLRETVGYYSKKELKR